MACLIDFWNWVKHLPYKDIKGHAHKYEAVSDCFVDIWIVVTFWSIIFI